MSLFPTTENPPPPGACESSMADARGLGRDEQSPLGSRASYDDVLDVAVQYTFPASDPIAVEQCCRDHPEREEGGAKGPGTTAGHGESIDV